MAEQASFRSFAKDRYSGSGEIVDLGSWLGSTTLSLAEGLRRNRAVSNRAGRIHAYDLFLWEDWMEPWATGCRRRYAPGESFLDEFEHRIRKHRAMIRVYPGDLTALGWKGGAIEFLLVDAMKSWPLALAIVRDFYVALVPGSSVVLHQDFKHHFTYWIHLVQYRHRRSFELDFDVPECGSTAFRMIAPLDPAVTLPAHLAEVGQEEWDAVFAHSIATLGGLPTEVASAHVTQLLESGQRGHGIAVLRAYIARGFSLEERLGWLTEEDAAGGPIA